MLHWARVSAVYWTSLHTIRWERQPNNFPFPTREIILGRCLALLVLCKGCFTGLTGTSRHLANGSVQACIHPKTHESQPLPNMHPAGDSGFSLEKFPGLSSWTLPCRPFKDWAAVALTVTTRRQHLPPPAGATCMPGICLATEHIPSFPAWDANSLPRIPILWTALESQRRQETEK